MVDPIFIDFGVDFLGHTRFKHLINESAPATTPTFRHPRLGFDNRARFAREIGIAKRPKFASCRFCAQHLNCKTSKFRAAQILRAKFEEERKDSGVLRLWKTANETQFFLIFYVKFQVGKWLFFALFSKMFWNFWIYLWMLFRNFWVCRARWGRILAESEERIEKIVVTSENEPRQKCEVFRCIFKKGRMTVSNSAKSRSFVQSFEQSKGRRPESKPSKFEQDRSRSRGTMWDDVLTSTPAVLLYY